MYFPPMRARGRRPATGARLCVALVVLAGLACEHSQTRRRSAVAIRSGQTGYHDDLVRGRVRN